MLASLVAELNTFVGSWISSLLVRGNGGAGWFDWKASIANRRSNYPANDPMVKSTIGKLKQFANTIQAAAGSAPIVHSHIDLLRAYQVTTDQLNKRIGDTVSKGSNTIVQNSKMDKACVRAVR